MRFTIENMAGGDVHTFRKLTAAARYIASRTVCGGFKISGDRVTPDSDYDDALAVVRYAEPARREVGRDDWDAVVEQCIRWFCAESETEDR